MCHTEALLFINHHQAEILETHVAGNQAMGADDEVHRAICQAGQGFADFRLAAEAVEQLDSYRVIRHALAEGAPVLLGEHGGGHQYGGLFATGDGLEHRADGDLGFAEAHIAADQPVHRARCFQVALAFLDGAALVRRLGEMERALEFPHPLGIGRMGVAGFVLALGLHAQQLGSIVENAFLRILAGGLPGSAAEFVQIGSAASHAHVFADEVGLFQRNAEQRAIAVFEHEFLAILALVNATEFRQAIFVVHHEVALLHFIHGGAGTGAAGFFQRAAARGPRCAVAAEQFRG